MALTITVDHPSRPVGTSKEVRGSILFDSSYPTGGEVVTPANFGLYALTALEVRSAAGFVFEWNRSTTAPKILAYWVDTTVDGAAMAEVVNTTDISAATARFTAVGY